MESSKSLVILSLSIPTFEDRLLQWAIKMLLESVYEQYFLAAPVASGTIARSIRPSWKSGAPLMTEGLCSFVDVDICKYYDTMDHGHLRSFFDRRVTDA